MTNNPEQAASRTIQNITKKLRDVAHESQQIDKLQTKLQAMLC